MAKLKPYLNIGPGEFIKEEMEARKWSNEDLAHVLGLNPKTISELLNNKQRITIDTAKILGKAFSQSPQYWLNLDNNYRLRMEEDNKLSDVEIKSKIYERMPVSDMIKKGWIKKYKNVDELENIFKTFWNIRELNYDFMNNMILPFTRKSEAYNNLNNYFLLTWLQKAKLSSENIRVNEFIKKDLNALARNITGYSMKKDGVAKFLADLTGTGVKFISLSHLPRTYLDGASFLYNSSPVLVYTKRYDRLDNFWFTISHEIGHILKHIKNEKEMFVDDLKIDDNSEKEKEANEFAEEILKVKNILNYFEEYKHYTSELRVLEASQELNVHKSIIVGILKFYKILSYNRLNRLNESVGEKIPKKYYAENNV